MQIKLPFGLVFSAVLNKAPYSCCLNPHIGIVRPQRGGLMLRFPPQWKIWNIELDAKKRAFMGAIKATDPVRGRLKPAPDPSHIRAQTHG